MYSSNKNLILWSYPLVRDYEVRKQELLALSSDTRVLFVKGTKDWVSSSKWIRALNGQKKSNGAVTLTLTAA